MQRVDQAAPEIAGGLGRAEHGDASPFPLLPWLGLWIRQCNAQLAAREGQ